MKRITITYRWDNSLENRKGCYQVLEVNTEDYMSSIPIKKNVINKMAPQLISLSKRFTVPEIQNLMYSRIEAEKARVEQKYIEDLVFSISEGSHLNFSYE